MGDNATVSASAHFHNLQLQKSPSRVFGQNSGNSADISKAFFQMGISKFESSQVEFAVQLAKFCVAHYARLERKPIAFEAKGVAMEHRSRLADRILDQVAD